jgi:RimJ/RimL family protein N-acetyltransferase
MELTPPVNSEGDQFGAPYPQVFDHGTLSSVQDIAPHDEQRRASKRPETSDVPGMTVGSDESPPGLGIPTLTGRLVRLDPLRPDHATVLLATVADPEVWRWKLAPYPSSVAEMREVITDSLIGRGSDRQPFLVSRLVDGRVLGSTTLYELDRRHQRVEMGWTWLERSAWGQGYNEDQKYSLLQYIFETMGLQRVAWRLDSLNLRSKNALERLGFVYEGKLRSHQQRPDGSRRDSLCYSLLAEEWPTIGPRLLKMVMARTKR